MHDVTAWDASLICTSDKSKAPYRGPVILAHITLVHAFNEQPTASVDSASANFDHHQ
jgi:hypothetical protein